MSFKKLITVVKTPSAFKHIQRAALILMAGTILENVASFVKSLFVAAYYGTSPEMDVYALSLTPVLLISGVLGSVIQATFIPKYLEVQTRRGDRDAFGLFLALALWLAAFLILLVLLMSDGSHFIASRIGAGFSASQQALLADLLNVSLLLLLLMMFEQLGSYLFHAHQQFAFPTFLPLINGAISLTYIILCREQGVSSLLWGLVLGMSAQCLVLLSGVLRFRPQRTKMLPLIDPELRSLFHLMLPLLIGASFGHINLLVDQIMASTLNSGSIAALNYAARLHNVLAQLFIMVSSKALLPFLAKQASENDMEALRTTFSLTIKRVLLILIPLSIAIICGAHFLVALVFQRGAFSAESTLATSGAWIAYTLGLPIQAVGILTARMYNVLQKNTTLMYVAGGNMGINIAFNLLFMRFWGHVGIALSTSASYVLTTGILLVCLRTSHFGGSKA